MRVGPAHTTATGVVLVVLGLVHGGGTRTKCGAAGQAPPPQSAVSAAAAAAAATATAARRPRPAARRGGLRPTGGVSGRGGLGALRF